jgi:hypothetical protein
VGFDGGDLRLPHPDLGADQGLGQLALFPAGLEDRAELLRRAGDVVHGISVFLDI